MKRQSRLATTSWRPVWIVSLLVVLSLTVSAQGDDVGKALSEMLSEAKGQVDFITAEELWAMMDRGQEIKLVDVRTEAEYQAGHLRGAVWVPRGKLEFIASAGEVLSVEDEIVVYCKQDGRSALAAATLKKLGFGKVKYFESGFKIWAEDGYPIYNLHGKLTVMDFEAEE